MTPPSDGKLKRAVLRHRLVEHVKKMQPFNWVRLCFFSCVAVSIVAMWLNAFFPFDDRVGNALTFTLAVLGAPSGLAFIVMVMERNL